MSLGPLERNWNADDAPSALEAIGAPNMKKIAEAALAAVGSEIPWKDDELRLTAIEIVGDAIESILDDLDAAFYRYPDDLTALLDDYVSNHGGEFTPKVAFLDSEN